MKLNLDKLRNTLRTTLIDIWEYVIPIWKISGLFKRIKSKEDLENFIQERSAHVSQTTLYGYLKTRIGVKYIAMMEDEVFLKSINIAKWNIYVVALADCAFYVFSYLISEKNLKENDLVKINKLKVLPIKMNPDGSCKLKLFDINNDIRAYFNSGTNVLDSILISPRVGVGSKIFNIIIAEADSLILDIGSDTSELFDLR